MVRFKNRYIAVEVNPLGQCATKPFSLKQTDVYNAVLEAVQKLHGEFGVAAITNGFSAKYCNEFTRLALLRVRHGPHRIVATALPCVTHVGKTPATIHTIYTGTTIKRCLLFLQRYQRSALDRLWSKLSTSQDRQALEEAVMDLRAVEHFHLKRGEFESLKKEQDLAKQTLK